MYQKRNKEFEIISLYRSDYKRQFYLRGISKLSNLPLKTVQNTLVKLEGEKILKSKTEGKNRYFSLNLDNIKTKSILLQSEVYRTDIFLETYPQFKTFLKSLNTNVPLIIFGSFARFTAGKNSDLDLLIISSKEQKLPFHLIPNKVHQIRLSEKSFIKSLNKNEILIKEIEESHIILNNHSFYINIMWGYYARK